MTKGADEGKEIMVEGKGPAGTYAVIESGAEEVKEIEVESGKVYEFLCDHLVVHGVKSKLESEGCKVLSTEAAYLPRMPIKLGAKGKAKIQSVGDSLMEFPNVVAFHTNVE